MKITTIPLADFPKLAWLSWLDQNCQHFFLIHGRAVEVRNRFFVEGAWNGDFASGQFQNTECFLGSGAVIEDNGVIFVSAANTVDSLYFTKRQRAFYVSNSLPLLLAALDDALRQDYPYHAFLNSTLSGIFDYQQNLPTVRGTIQRLLFRNLQITPHGAVVQDKSQPPAFPSYDDYVGYLESSYASIVRNARSSHRTIPIEVFSTQSRGYDTTAINAIAAQHGLDKVFSCTTSRDKSSFVGYERTGQASDDGSIIGQSLGFSCVPLDRLSYQTYFPDEELYLAGHYDPHDINLRQINDYVSKVALLLTGVRGEIWYGTEFYKKRKYRSDSLMKFDMAGHGLSELRLHAGLIPFPFPFLGAQRQKDIHAITSSDAMNAWRLGTAYDRPIPRRIAEERGVPRHQFGQIKLNTTVAFPKPTVPFTPELRSAYFDFLKESGLATKLQIISLPLVHRLNQAIYYRSPRRYSTLYYGERIVSRLVRRPVSLKTLSERLTSTAFIFCVNRTIEQYRNYLKADMDKVDPSFHANPPTLLSQRLSYHDSNGSARK